MTAYRNVLIVVAVAVVMLLAAACDKTLTDPSVKAEDRVSPVYVRDAVTGKCVELSGGGEAFTMRLKPDAACDRHDH